jgi:catechol 2,3-dioxygenase
LTGNGSIDPRTTVGAVRLRVADLEGARDFYERALGLTEVSGTGEAGITALGAGARTLVELEADPEAVERPSRTTGLFHLAILQPSRAELARAIHRIANAGARLTGASDHLVSEALYLYDPEGNGLEVYRDRPREEWPVRDGQIQMDTLPLDLNAVLNELEDGEIGPSPEGTRMGHVHLNVADLEATEDFYAGVLGFEVTVRGYPGALFVSAGGYHHHIGLNTWAGEGAPPPPEGSRGLLWYELRVPAEELDRIEGRLGDAGIGAERDDAGIHTRDPSGNGVLLAPEAQP